MIMKLFGLQKKIDPSSMLARRDGLIRQMDFILDTLENNKFDILYMQNLKNPLSHEEQVYFIQQIDKIESTKKIVLWMKENINQNTPLWRKLLRW